MSTIAFPDFLEDPSEFSLRSLTNQLANASPYGGSEQVIDKRNDRWLATVSISPRTHDEAADVEAWVASMRGLTNVVNLYHLQRPEPRGTMRGAPTVQATAAGLGSVRINTTPGATLRAGDMIGISGLLLQVEQNCVADGTGLLVAPIVNRLRRALGGGAPVVWNRPSAPFRFRVVPEPISYVPGYTPEVTFDFMEQVG
jgi:hypothetical protein